MADSTRTFRVHVFSAEATVEVNAPAIPAAIKLAVGRHFQLNPKSLEIFGIFRGALGNPKALLSGNQLLCQTISDVSFQRLSFDTDLEVSIANDDDKAIRLLFEELKYEYNHFRVLPIVTSLQMKQMDRLLANESLLSSEDRFEKQVEFFNLICNHHPLYFWSHYYRAENCVLLNSSLPVSSLVEMGMKLHAAISPDHLILLEPTAADGKELLKLSWSMVHSVRMQKSPRMLVKFETLIPSSRGEGITNELTLISLETDRNEYLYTLTRHVLKWHEAKKFQGMLIPQVSLASAKAEINPRTHYCYVNQLFCKPM